MRNLIDAGSTTKSLEWNPVHVMLNGEKNWSSKTLLILLLRSDCVRTQARNNHVDDHKNINQNK